VGYRCPATEVPNAIERALHNFQENRQDSESLARFFSRHSTEQLRGIFAGDVVEMVPRDVPTESQPLGVEG
jgi:sulfite reductase (ferredoxin)